MGLRIIFRRVCLSLDNTEESLSATGPVQWVFTPHGYRGVTHSSIAKASVNSCHFEFVHRVLIRNIQKSQGPQRTRTGFTNRGHLTCIHILILVHLLIQLQFSVAWIPQDIENIYMIALQSSCRFLRRTFISWISCSTTTQRCWTGFRSFDKEGHWIA